MSFNEPPPVPTEFADYAAERGWNFVWDYQSMWVDEEGVVNDIPGEVIGGFWDAWIVREEKVGDLWFCQRLSVNPRLWEQAYEPAWKAHIELATAAWDRQLEEHHVA